MAMALKVFDLACEHDHLFEGWFSSQDSYESQLEHGQVRCPVCQSDQITRRVSAPRLNLSQSKNTATEVVSREDEPNDGGGVRGVAAVASPTASQLARLQAQVLRQMRRIVSQTDNVGEQFANEARRMHAGEIEERPIRGVASPQECRELAEEGISIMPIPDILDDDRLQ